MQTFLQIIKIPCECGATAEVLIEGICKKGSAKNKYQPDVVSAKQLESFCFSCRKRKTNNIEQNEEKM